jgi:hypothetical protein
LENLAERVGFLKKGAFAGKTYNPAATSTRGAHAHPMKECRLKNLATKEDVAPGRLP